MMALNYATIGVKPIHEQVDELILSEEERVVDLDARVLVLKVFQLQVDNLNRVWKFEVFKKQTMEDLLSAIILIFDVKVSFNDLLEIRSNGYTIFGHGILVKTMDSFKTVLDRQAVPSPSVKARGEIRVHYEEQIAAILGNSKVINYLIIRHAENE